jgi:hypothetical protein
MVETVTARTRSGGRVGPLKGSKETDGRRVYEVDLSGGDACCCPRARDANEESNRPFFSSESCTLGGT